MSTHTIQRVEYMSVEERLECDSPGTRSFACVQMDLAGDRRTQQEACTNGCAFHTGRGQLQRNNQNSSCV